MTGRTPTKLLVVNLILLMIVSGCNKPSGQDIGEAVWKAEDYFKKSKEIDCVGAFDGKTVKFRLLIEEEPTIDEAKKLFSEVLKTIEIYTNKEETWNYYNASLEIAYKDTVIFEGYMESGDNLKVRTN